MNETTNRHLPTPEFRGALERDLVRALKRQSQFEPPSMSRRRRLRTAVTLLIGLSLGAGGAVASAQVQGARERDSLTAVANFKRQMAMLRLELAEATFKSTEKAVNVGARSRDDLVAARLQVRIETMNVRLVDLELEEVRATGAAPRDELWSPLAGKRDFVFERLMAEIDLARQKLESAERDVVDARIRFNTGITAASDTLERQMRVLEIIGEMEMGVQKVNLRGRFLKQEIDEKALVTELQLMKTSSELRRLVERLKEAKLRSTRARQQRAVGAADELDVKRAEVDVLERSLEIEQLQTLMRRLTAAVRKD